MALLEKVQCNIASWVLRKVFDGVVRAQELDSETKEAIIDWISSQDNSATDSVTLSLQQWRALASVKFEQMPDLRTIGDLALGIAYLQECGRDHEHQSRESVADVAWSLICDTFENPLCHAKCSHSPQGFLVVHLCSLMVGDRTDILFRLHVWLPQQDRADPRFRIHSHQPFAQSWILAGTGFDESYDVKSAEEVSDLAYAKYCVMQNFAYDGKTQRRRRVSSTISNTGALVKVTPLATTAHTRNMTYIIPAGEFHASEIPKDQMHATLFFFDSQRGFLEDAAVLGPVHNEPFTNIRGQDSVSPTFLRRAIDDLRMWEDLMAQGHTYQRRMEKENALDKYKQAKDICTSSEVLSQGSVYMRLTSEAIGGA